MTKIILILVLAMASISGCTTIENHYAVTGNENWFSCPSTAAPVKVIDTGLTASASQAGDAGAESAR